MDHGVLYISAAVTALRAAVTEQAAFPAHLLDPVPPKWLIGLTMSLVGAARQNPAIARLLRDEEEYGLWTQSILGYPVYPHVRLLHYRRALLALSGIELNERSFSEHASFMTSRVRTSLAGIVEHWSNRFEGRDIWVLSSSNYRRRDGGALENIFTQHLVSQCDGRLVFLEKNLVNLPNQHRSDVCFVDALHWAALRAGKAAAPALAWAIERDIAQRFQPTSRRRMAALAVCGLLLERAYGNLLERHAPKAVFVLNSYSEFIPAQRAVKRLGIPLIEIQHGIIHHSHPGYAYPNALLPSHAPDHIVTFGARFGQILEETSPYWQGRWSVGGHAWLQKRAAGATHSGLQRAVVFFSQPEPDVQRQVGELATQVRRLLDPDVEVVLKPHPNERNTDIVYAQAIAAGVRLAGNLDDSYGLLARCNVAVSVYSTVALEALAFPCMSAVVRSSRWTEEIRAFVELGQLRAVEQAMDIVKLTHADVQGTSSVESGRALFGVGEPHPDFERLIHDVAARIADERRAIRLDDPS